MLAVGLPALGTPNPEITAGGLSGRVDKIGVLVGKLSKIKEIRDINILINGTPMPELANVRFTMQMARQ